MSFREKCAWISVCSMLAIGGAYFGSLGAGGLEWGGFHGVSLLTAAVVLLVTVQGALRMAVAVHRPGEARPVLDEREKLIDLKAMRIAYYGLAWGVITACLLGTLSPPVVFDTNSLLFVLLTVEVLRAAAQILYFRLGG
jgi:hypothetical protein